MTHAVLRRELLTRGLPGIGTKETLLDTLLANEKARFAKFGPGNDPDGIQRSALILSRSKAAVERAEGKYRRKIAEVEGLRGRQVEEIENVREVEMEVLRRVIVEVKDKLARRCIQCEDGLLLMLATES